MHPIHPGEILREEFMIPLGLSANALAIALRVPAPRINDIARERRAVSADTALRLARYFGTSAEFWLGLQSDYDMKIAMAESGARIEKEASDLMRIGCYEGPARRRVERHHHHQHHRAGAMAPDYFQRIPLAQQAPIVQAEHDMRNDF